MNFKPAEKQIKTAPKRRLKLKMGDVFEFKIDQNKIEKYDNDIPHEVRSRAECRYGIVVNEKEHGAIPVKLKRVDSKQPSIE